MDTDMEPTACTVNNLHSNTADKQEIDTSESKNIIQETNVDCNNSESEDDIIFHTKLKKQHKHYLSDSDNEDEFHNIGLSHNTEGEQSLFNQNLEEQGKDFVAESVACGNSNEYVNKSEDDNEYDDSSFGCNKKKASSSVSSGDEADHLEILPKQDSSIQQIRRIVRRKSSSSTSDSEHDSIDSASIHVKERKKYTTKSLAILQDNDSSCDEQSSKSEAGSRSFNNDVSKNTSKESMRKIHSESQRMVRESSACLPYHKPKQRSLLEFLNRKRVTPNSNDRVKPRPRDLDAVAQVLEERAKEVEEFFKSDSEESANDDKESESELSLPNDVPINRKQSELLTSSSIHLGNNINSSDITSVEKCDAMLPLRNPSLQESFNEENNAVVLQNSKLPNQNQDHFDLSLENIAEKSLDETGASCVHDSLALKMEVENVKRLSVARVRKPTLCGRPGELLHLDAGDVSTSEQKAKVNNFIEQFVQQITSNKKSPKKTEVQISIVQKVVNAEGQLELKRDVMNVPVDKANDTQAASAGRRQLLKESLRQSISAKRAVDRIKKLESHETENKTQESGNESEIEEDILSDETDSDDEEEDIRHLPKRKKSGLKLIESRALEDEFDLENECDEDPEALSGQGIDENEVDCISNESSKDDSEKQELTNSRSVARRLITKLHSHNSDHFSSLEDLTPRLNTSDSSQEDLISNLKPSQNNDSSNVEELLALCSGKFPDATLKVQTAKSLEDADENFDEDAKPFSRIIPIVEDDDSCTEARSAIFGNDIEDESECKPLFLNDDNKKSQLRKRKKARIHLSDDEDEETLGQFAEDEDEMHEEEIEFRGLNDFFEDEAELSGSEVGSCDEREDDEDNWEVEEGDKDDIDENEVREQVGRAHIKTLLDQDQREVRLFQELFLEDGDLHTDGGGRQRQFRWKNTDGEDIGDSTARLEAEDEQDNVAEEDDLTWRKIRNEREKWLQEQKSKQEISTEVPLIIKRNGKAVKINSKSKASRPLSNHTEKVDDATSAVTANLGSHSSQDEHARSIPVRRGSFLRRSEKDLSAIASLTKSVLPVQAPKTGSNFVFASITPERPVISEEKRKIRQNAGEPSDQNPVPPKKAKVSLSSKSIFSYF